MMTKDDYCLKLSSAPSEARKALADYTRGNIPHANMLIGELEGAFFQFLLKSMKATSVLEIGTYTGYSALTFAESLPENGKVLTLDINQETTQLAQSFWDKSPAGKKIEAFVGDSHQKLKTLISENKKFDVIFIDADKENYPLYVDFAKKLLSPHGVIMIDNVLWSGKVLEAKGDASTEAIKTASAKVREDQDLECVMLPVRDGVMLARFKH